MDPILICFAIWFVVGVWSHVHWVRSRYDYTTDQIMITLMSGIIGPLGYLVGWIVYGVDDNRPARTIFKRRS